MYNNPQLVHAYDDARIFVITEVGAVSFPDAVSLNSPNFFLQQEEVRSREVVHNMHYNSKHGLVLLACGLEGLDVYLIKNGTLSYLKTYRDRDLGISQGQLNVMDVDSNSDLDKLYVLDYVHGLLVFQLSHYDQLVEPLFGVAMTRATDFDHFQSTFFIIGQTY